MRISELSRRSGVPLATIKFYLRERLLHEGRLTSATQARYDESHLARLRLIQALTGPAGLSVAKTRRVLTLIDEPTAPTLDLLGSAHEVVSHPPAEEPPLEQVDAALRRLGWEVSEENQAHRAEVAAAVAAIGVADFALPERAFEGYATAMLEVAAMEIAAMPTESAEAAVRYVVLGTVLVEPLLLALRRLAQQEASKRRFGPPSEAARTPGQHVQP
ncbi:MerR family transcriptional regulator [Microlunatus ginsengisoli]|uniref:MerR family transcriptional regulator n=1 Tax=Microlunatus ginsengisoli TaxID=363863 RepID=A0ABP7ANX7_9ACTN